MDDPPTLDHLDRKILAELVTNARLPVTELARRVGLSKTPVAARIRALEQAGVITGYRAILSPDKLGLSHVTFVQIRLTETSERALLAFNAAVSRLPQVASCHMIAGGFDYLLKIRSQDIAAYRKFLGDTLSSLPHVASTATFVAMETVIDNTPDPVQTQP